MIENGKRPGTISSLIARKWNLTFNRRCRGYGHFVLAHQAEKVLFLPYPDSKRPRTDLVSVMKSRPRLIDFSYRDDAFQENVDIHKDSAIDVMIEDIRPLLHESCLAEDLDIAIDTYFEEVQNDETEIEWDSDEETNEYSDATFGDDSDEHFGT
ncbi:hypothetical protein M9H77_25676 [Catharanthus roseus]|uniref:Uncharacterized protein n=1 Tax=Catharanthus roseus TaxID=4058 RepID=A0ACC0AA70_CATRO|nr:hypothetical protein M9H77_25676 [Catharanthus roseus]